MEKINVAELLKDCPRGMKLDCTMYDNLYFDQVCDDDDCLYPIGCYTIADEIRTSINFTEFGGFNIHINSKCVIFPEGKTTWEGFVPPHEFKDGDIAISDKGDIHLLRTKDSSYCAYRKRWKGLPAEFDETITASVKVDRLATEEEKAELFQAIKDNGYKWNEVTKTLEELSMFEDGDILSYTTTNTTVFIYRNKYNEPNHTTSFYVGYTIGKEDHNFHVYNKSLLIALNEDCEVRFATEEEKEELFQAIKENGYRWNSDTKTLEKLLKFKVGNRIKHKTHISQGDVVTEIKDTHYILNNELALPFIFQDEWELVPDKFDITTLKPFDKVLVRMDDKHVWSIQFFERLNTILKDSFVCMGGGRYHQCIPYEGNEHLLNKVVDCDEFYRTWEKTGD